MKGCGKRISGGTFATEGGRSDIYCGMYGGGFIPFCATCTVVDKDGDAQPKRAVPQFLAAEKIQKGDPVAMRTKGCGVSFWLKGGRVGDTMVRCGDGDALCISCLTAGPVTTRNSTKAGVVMTKVSASERLEGCRRRRSNYIVYLKDRIEDEDWHGGSDACNDLRELDAEIRELEDRA